MFEAVLIDFYGTIVHEDDEVVTEICNTISEAMTEPADPRNIGNWWWQRFSESCGRSHGSSFRSQRELEHESIEQTIGHFSAACSADALSSLLFQHWVRSPAFDDALPFLEQVGLPVFALSNIDRPDLTACIRHHGMTFADVITSEDVRAYKPHPAMFEAGFKATGVADRRHVLHIGDSLASDVEGAIRSGVPVAWVNRAGKRAHGELRPDHVVSTLTELLPLFPRC